MDIEDHRTNLPRPEGVSGSKNGRWNPRQRRPLVHITDPCPTPLGELRESVCPDVRPLRSGPCLPEEVGRRTGQTFRGVTEWTIGKTTVLK